MNKKSNPVVPAPNELNTGSVWNTPSVSAVFFSFEKQETIGGSTGPLKAALVAPRRNRQWAVRWISSVRVCLVTNITFFFFLLQLYFIMAIIIFFFTPEKWSLSTSHIIKAAVGDSPPPHKRRFWSVILHPTKQNIKKKKSSCEKWHRIRFDVSNKPATLTRAVQLHSYRHLQDRQGNYMWSSGKIKMTWRQRDWKWLQ